MCISITNSTHTGAVVSEMRYHPFGETRWVSGTLPDDKRVILAGLADLRGLWVHVGGRNQPDFVGRGLFGGLAFDITTPGQVSNHIIRPYGGDLIFGLYTRPEWFSRFP